MTNREEFLTDAISPFGTPVDDERLLPSWLCKEAAVEEDWEKKEKRHLEISSFARDFARSFPLEAFAGVYRQDRNSSSKTLIKSAEDVISDAYDWLTKKTKGDWTRTKEILEAAGLPDEHVAGIHKMFLGAAEEPAFKEEEAASKEHEKLDKFSDLPSQPGVALRQFRDGVEETTADEVLQDHNLARLEKTISDNKARQDYAPILMHKKKVASYAIVVTEEAAQLFKKGELLSSLPTDDLGGFAIAADEVSTLETAADVETLFGVEPPSPSSTPGRVAMNKCCVAFMDEQKYKFCPECGDKIDGAI